MQCRLSCHCLQSGTNSESSSSINQCRAMRLLFGLHLASTPSDPPCQHQCNSPSQQSHGRPMLHPSPPDFPWQPPQQECPSCSHKHTQNRLETFVDPPSCQPSRIHSRLAALPACTWQCHVRAPHGLMTHVQPVDMDGEARSQSGRDPNGWMDRLAR